MGGQLQTLERRYRQAGFAPSTLGLFKAHGTGTAVGDQTECLALRALLEQHRAAANSVAVGSVKSMIGHTKCAAGVSGLLKATLALHHRVLPPTLHVERPNPKAMLTDDGPLYVNSELRPWLHGESPQHTGVSAFGFGGSNFHVVLEEYEGHACDAPAPLPHRDLPAELFLFRATEPAELAGQMRGLVTGLRQATDAGVELRLADLAFTQHAAERSAATRCRGDCRQ